MQKRETSSCGGFLFLLAFEHAGLERMALEQAIELGAVAAGKAGRLRHVTPGYLQDSYQVVALEGPPRLVQRGERRVGDVQRLAHQRLGNDLGGSEGNGLLDDIEKLAHVALAT